MHSNLASYVIPKECPNKMEGVSIVREDKEDSKSYEQASTVCGADNAVLCDSP